MTVRSPAADRRRSLLDAADVVVRRDGPEASVAAIAAAAGVTKPIVYRHFGDKAGLYRALAERHVEDLLDRLGRAIAGADSRHGRTRAAVQTYLAMVEEDPDAYRFLLHHAAQGTPAFPGLVASYLRRVAEVLAPGIAAELGLPTVDGRPHPRACVFAHGMVGAVHAAGDWWLDEQHIPRARLVDDLTDLLWGAWADGSRQGAVDGR